MDRGDGGHRIPTTHTGSLPRPDDLVELLWAREAGEAIDKTAVAERTRETVRAVVQRQLTVGLDIVNDGEAGKLSYAAYVRDRLSGFAAAPDADGPLPADLADFPGYAAQMVADRRYRSPVPAACVGPVSYRGRADLKRDLGNLQQALVNTEPAEVFVTAASPGVIAFFHSNRYYPSHEAYVWAIAEAMRIEYEAIHCAGFLLQVDCPDLAAGRHARFAHLDLDGFRRIAALNVAALNHATAAIPPAAMRLHMCWGNYEGPHHRDVPLAAMVDIVLGARPAGLSVEAANPRHGHEWRVWEHVPLPEGKVLIPGVIDTTTNFVEHPELVAERLVRFAGVVGRERVIAGSDCGLATVAGSIRVDPEIAWAKLGSLVEGARLASATLW
jgi:5-methyltetrahydropteroyltriglutamate--homocysteine methyltransferase